MTRHKHVSIIVPAYNSEKYISRCLNSLVNLVNFNDVEILVINDASDDETPKIIDLYANNYENIRAYHFQKNRGVSAARNFGIEHSRGEYFTFVDSDDWVDSNIYNMMYEIAHKRNIDVVGCGLLFEWPGNKEIKYSINSSVQEFTRGEAVKHFLYGTIDVHVVDKLFKRNKFKNIKFNNEIRVGEDRLYLCEILLNTDNYYIVSDCFYHYFQNIDSTMYQKFSEKNLDLVKVSYEISEMVKNDIPELKDYADCMSVSDLCRIYTELNLKDNKLRYDEDYKKIKKIIKAFSVKKMMKFSSTKHTISFMLAKYFPRLYQLLRSNDRLRLSR